MPRVTARDVVRVVGRLGFTEDRRSGSHAVFYRAGDGRRVVVPIHAGTVIKPKTLKGIVADLGIDMDEFRKLL